MENRATSGKVARALATVDVVQDLGDWATGTGPLFRQLARALAGTIERGALGTGSRLPSERALAVVLGVGRGTAVAAYDLLVGDGLVERRHGSGTYVVGAGDLALPAGREGTALVHRLVDRSSTGQPAVIDLSISVLGDASGLPPLRLDTADLVAVEPDTGYSPWGLPGLRDALAAELSAGGLPTTAAQLVVTTGAQQAISAAAACWVRPGDEVVVDDPTYPGAIAAFTAAGARLVGVPVDRHGVDVGALRAALARSPALAYLQSGPHSPTGTVLGVARREAVAELVVAARVPLVEDVALAPLAWRRLPPPVAALAPDAPIAVVGSLSKRFWGGLRLGWVRAPEPVALRFARVKATQDLGSSAVAQVLAERLLRHPSPPATGGDDTVPHVHRLRYEALAEALRRHLPTWSWSEPAGGLSLWVRLPDGADAGAFAQVALRHGVAVATAEALSPTPARHGDRLRISFSARPDLLEEGVRRLAEAWTG
jgi:DNA-binding transcriptional MocR family regulator